jgi:membrane-bound serine protease (ClpP class)
VNPADEKQEKKQKGPEEMPAGTALEHKAINDAVAYIRSLAQLRGRNAEWAEAAVRGAASLSADDALQQHVIEIIAKDVPDLLQQLHGRKVKAMDREMVLETRGLAVRSIVPDWRTRVLLILTHPTIAYGLLLIGIYGLLLEGYNPGAVLPGVAGALALLLGLYGLQLLEVNYAGLALMALGVGLIVAEFFMPAFGSLGVGGLAAFVIGSILLFDNRASGLRVALPLIVGIAVAGGLVIVTVGWLAARARRRPLFSGVETMIGASVEAVRDCQDRCVVRYGGELWNARTASPLRAGQQARIVRVVELTLWVEPQQDQ